MGQLLHGSATTTEAVRRVIQHSQESLRALAKRYGINQKTVAKWRSRDTASKRQHLCRLLSGVLDSITPYIRMSSNVTSVPEAQQDHRKLFAAIKGGDAKSARRLCK
jgi:DNA-binding FadR family transcriptional regulator